MTNGTEHTDTGVGGRQFALSSHPRLGAIARAGNVVLSPADSHLPDLYDGLSPEQNELKIHVYIGLPLFANEELIGALTFDSLNPALFDAFSDKELWLIGAVASSALYNALLVDALEKQALPTAAETNSKKQITWQKEDDMAGSSALMRQLRHEINVFAGSDLNELITGEMGVGQNLVANAVHQLSPRAAKP